MQRRINNIERSDISLGRDAAGKHAVKIAFYNLIADKFDLSAFNCLIKINGFNIIENINAVHYRKHIVRSLKPQLAAVRAVCLVSVIFRGIVACGNHHARVAVQMPYRVRQHRSRHKFLININLNAVSRENSRRSAGKKLALYSAVVCYGDLSVTVHGIYI